MAGGASDDGERREGTPRAELARIRESRAESASAVSDRIMVATLEACGERGFRGASVQDVIDRCGGNRVQFYRHFASKPEAYAAAHEREIEALGDNVLAAAGSAGAWRPGLRAALEELAGFIAGQPLLARGLLVEVHVAGGPSLAKRAEVHERFAEAIDLARKEAAASEAQAPPALTAKFMLGAIDSAACSALSGGDPSSFAAAVPELAHMVVAAYFGETVAAEELISAGGA